MTLEKQYIEILKQRGLITGVMYYENQDILDLITNLAVDQPLWEAIKMFMEAPILIDENEDNAHTKETGRVEKEYRTSIKQNLHIEDPHLFNAYQTNKMRKNFILPIIGILPDLILLPRDKKRFDGLRYEFFGHLLTSQSGLPTAYEYEMSNPRKRGFVASLIALIENVAKSQIKRKATC